MEPCFLTIKSAQKQLKEKNLSSQELVQSCLERIERLDKKIKAFITLCPKEALKAAEQADKKIASVANKNELLKQKPLLGIPLAVKDIFVTAEIRTTAASKVLENFIPAYEATVVARLKQAGAIILGKTNLDSFCHGSSTETSDFFTTKNPWDLNKLPGGSSGGSAASVIADLAIASLGTETAGSIRQPSAWCGVVGLKPTYGRVSRFGVIAMASSFDSPGPIAKKVEDAALILEIIAGKDFQDATSLPAAVPQYSQKLKKGIKGLVLGVPEQYFLKQAQPGINQKVKRAIEVLEKLGAKIQKINLLDPHLAIAVYTILQRSEVSSNLGRYDSIRYGQDRNHFNQENQRRIMLGTYTLSAGYYQAYYLQAQKARTLIIKDFEKIFEKVDLVVSPTSPTTALPLGATKSSAMFGELQDILLEASSIAGLPGISLPCGFVNNLPVGLQITGPQLGEEKVLRAGWAYEQATDWSERKPKL